MASSSPEPADVLPPRRKKRSKAEVPRKNGTNSLQQKDPQAAVTYFSECIALSPRQKDFSNRGLAFYQLGNLTSAQDDCSTALAMDPNDTKTLARRGRIRKDLGHISESLSDLSEVLKAHPDDAGTRELVSHMSTLRAKYERDQIRTLMDAIDCTPSPASVWYLVSQRWWTSWKSFVQYDEGNSDDLSTDVPTEIDNTHLIIEEELFLDFVSPSSLSSLSASAASASASLSSFEKMFCVKRELVEQRDFLFLPQVVWDKLHACYGGGPVIQRFGIQLSQGLCQIEVHPYRLYIEYYKPVDSVTPHKTRRITQSLMISRTAAMSRFITQLCIYLRSENVAVEEEAMQLTKLGEPNERLNISDASLTVADCSLVDGDTLTVSFDRKPEPLPEPLPATTVDDTKNDVSSQIKSTTDSSSTVAAQAPLVSSTVDVHCSPVSPVIAAMGNSDSAAGPSIESTTVPSTTVGTGSTTVGTGSTGQSSLSSTTVTVPVKIHGVACGHCKTVVKRAMVCSACKSIRYCSAECQRAHRPQHKEFCIREKEKLKAQSEVVPVATTGGLAAAPRRGLTGLRNLGNTCFMNSALQCLSNTEVLTRFFLSKRYVSEINSSNPLGTGGRLAAAYGQLLDSMWVGTSSVVSPFEFKRVLEKFAPQFSGFAQHDSQELLAFVLDGLHEDLNRVLKKPYVELKDSSDESNQYEAAHDAWAGHLLRNDSIIVDTMQGQYKSKLVCPVCSKVSITFDPFMYLSLPISEKQYRLIDVLLFDELNRQPTKYRVKVPSGGDIADLRTKLGQLSGISSSKITLTLMQDRRIKSIFKDGVALTDIDIRDVLFGFVLQTPSLGEPHRVQILLGCPPAKRKLIGMTSFAYPMLGCVSGDMRLSHLRRYVWNILRRFLSPGGSPMPLEAEYTLKFTSGQPAPGLFKLSKLTGLTCAMCGEAVCDCEIPDSVEETVADFITAHGVSNKTFCVRFDWSDAAFERLNKEEIGSVQVHSSVQAKFSSDEEAKKSLHLLDCVRLFSQEETLGRDNAWYCPQCKEHQQASKKMDVWKLPAVLVIHLKRFSSRSYFKDKLDTLVDFPLVGLDLSEFARDLTQTVPPVYDLFAVSNHFGGAGFGHYTAFAKNFEKDEWFCFDDSSVTPISESAVKSSAAYVLFYKRRG